jgi:hypothetical protein
MDIHNNVEDGFITKSPTFLLLGMEFAPCSRELSSLDFQIIFQNLKESVILRSVGCSDLDWKIFYNHYDWVIFTS